MQKDEYRRMFEVENEHFWYKGMRKISSVLLKKYFFDPTLNRVNGKKVLKMLDAGCGTGANLNWLNQFGDGYGFDISNEAIKFCKKRRLKNVQQASIEKIPFPKNYFNIVICFDVLGQKQVINHDNAIKELHRVLKPKGILLLRVAAFNWLYSYHDSAVHTKHRYSRKELLKLFRTHKFNILRSTYANMFLFPISLLMRKKSRLFNKGHLKESDVQKIHPFFNMFFYIFLFLESQIIRLMSLPFGLSVIILAQKKK